MVNTIIIWICSLLAVSVLCHVGYFSMRLIGQFSVFYFLISRG